MRWDGTNVHRRVSLLGRCDLACLICMAAVLLDGCGLSYHLRGQGRTTILTPPVPPAILTGTRSVSQIRVAKARSRPAGLDGCDIQNDLLELQWLGNAAEIQLRPDSYFPTPGDERTEEVAPRVYLDSTQSLEAFRNAFQDSVVKGCLRSDEAQRITRTIVERFSLPPLIASFIRFGGGASGFVDLTADFRLKVVSPVHSIDNRKGVVGYQIAYYRLTPEPKGARVRISLASISSSAPQGSLRDESGSTKPLEFSPSFRFFRLLFRTAQSSADHLATVLSADDEASLNQATRRFEMAGDPSCEVLSIRGVTCTAPAPEVAVNLEFPVLVNSRQVFVSLGGTLANAMEPRKQASEIPATLRIRRLFEGRLRTVKFDAASQDILGFVLMPGDEITW